MVEAVGFTVIVGFAFAIINETLAVKPLKLPVSVGVKLISCIPVPAIGVVDGLVNAKTPGTVVRPFASMDAAKVWP